MTLPSIREAALLAFNPFYWGTWKAGNYVVTGDTKVVAASPTKPTSPTSWIGWAIAGVCVILGLIIVLVIFQKK